ncbi:unnamed protein product [Ambrosiozyma monospora]|uniref:Unnamed protein product n=1 Tax=Ambrosiozyma monospora TaxID=43982 RepID=A0ACB5U4L1_AMBMO|nr:unnamed protein product [Ambrosiozyma monospora]
MNTIETTPQTSIESTTSKSHHHISSASSSSSSSIESTSVTIPAAQTTTLNTVVQSTSMAPSASTVQVSSYEGGAVGQVGGHVSLFSILVSFFSVCI